VIRAALLAALCSTTAATAGFPQPKPSGECGEVVTIPTQEVAAGIARFIRGARY